MNNKSIELTFSEYSILSNEAFLDFYEQIVVLDIVGKAARDKIPEAQLEVLTKTRSLKATLRTEMLRRMSHPTNEQMREYIEKKFKEQIEQMKKMVDE